jgi:hypothetical protein
MTCRKMSFTLTKSSQPDLEADSQNKRLDADRQLDENPTETKATKTCPLARASFHGAPSKF